MYDIIVFENLRFRLSTRERMASSLKNLHSGERCYKDAFSVTVFTEKVWTTGQTGGKKSPFSNKNGYVWTEPNFHYLTVNC